MAKKKIGVEKGTPPPKRKKPNPSPPPPEPRVQERSSFLPDENAKAKDGPEDIAVDVKTESDMADFEQKVSLAIWVAADRRLRVTLEVTPLRPYTYESNWLLSEASAEQKAGHLAKALIHAADQVAQDAEFQHAVRQNEEAEAKERFRRRA